MPQSEVSSPATQQLTKAEAVIQTAPAIVPGLFDFFVAILLMFCGDLRTLPVYACSRLNNYSRKRSKTWKRNTNGTAAD